MDDAVGPKRILVIDDHDLVRNLVLAILQKAGFEALSASCGPEGLEMYEENMTDIACVLLDLSMPQMNGPEVLTRLKEIDNRVKVILMSAHDESAGAALIREAGAVGYLRKPFKPDALIKTVNDVVAIAGA